MNKYVVGLVMAAAVIVTPLTASASQLTTSQVNAIIGVLQSFGVAQNILDSVYADLVPRAPISVVKSGANIVVPVNKVAIAQSSNGIIAPMNTLEAYRIAYITDGSTFNYPGGFINYWGSELLDSTSISLAKDGVTSTSTISVLGNGAQGNNCINLWNNDGQWVDKKCGGYYVHFGFSPELTPGTYTVTLTDSNANTVTSDITVK